MTKEKAAENSFSLKYKTLNWQVISGVALGVSLVAGAAFFFHPFVSETSYATNSNVSVGYSGSDWVITAPTSTAADTGGLEFDIEGNPAGVNMAKKDTVTGGGTNVPDYQIYVSVDTEGGQIPATSGDAAIAATAGTVTDATSDVSGAAALSTNSWGFALPSFSTGINYDDLVSSSSSSSWASSKWSKLPYVATASLEDESTVESTATKIYDSTTSTTDSVDVYYAVNANNDLASGEYQTTVTYTLIGEMPAPTELADGLKMQEVTTDTCANTDTYASTGKTYELVDSRDNSTYQVRKLADGNCWMVQNLRLINKTISSSDSDTSDSFTIPASSTTSGSGDGEWCIADSSACDNRRVAQYNNNTTYGTYYNWYTATAGSGTYETISDNVNYSICPKGWKLPTGGSSGQFQTLYTAYGSNASSFQTATLTGSGYLAGVIFSGTLSNAGSRGGWWSRMAGNAIIAYTLYAGSDDVDPQNYANKYLGLSVRCVLPSE